MASCNCPRSEPNRFASRWSGRLGRFWPHADAQRRRLLRTSEHHLGRSAAEGAGSGARVDHCGADVGGDSDSPLRERKVRGRQTRRPTANAVLTTVVDTWGRSWTPRCSSRSSDLIRRTVVDSRGPGHSPENRMVTSRWSPVSRRCGPAASRSAAATRLDQAELARCSACHGQLATVQVTAPPSPDAHCTWATVTPGGSSNVTQPFTV